MRRGIQIISIVAFLALFFLAAYPLQQLIPVDLFLRFDPLIAITAMLASRTLIAGMFWSILLVVSALIYGRAFCGYVCPLGSTIDVFDRILWQKQGGRVAFLKSHNIAALRKLKFYILVFVLISSVFGIMTIHFFDPLSLITRILTVLVFPLVLFVGNLLLDLFRPVAEALNWFSLARLSLLQHTYYMGIITFFFFAVILALGRLQSRFWCRNVCPLGALLGLLARFGLVKRSVSKACIDCGKCQRICPTAAIPENPRHTMVTECIQCRDCKHVCPIEAIRFPLAAQPATHNTQLRTFELSRRGFLASVGAGVASSFMLSVHPSKGLLDGGLIRPPGSVPEEMLLDRCIRCGECMKACTTNTLQTSFLESGPERLWSPKLVMRYAPCEQRCNVCGQVCPTDAIRALDLEERKHAKIGTAVLYRDRCLVWEQDKLCLICDEQCPYDAIEFRIVDGVRRPFVLEDRCNGCGVCENKCPVQGQAAIVVTPIAAMRLVEGSYIEEAKRLGYEFSEAREETEQFFLDEQQPENLQPDPASPQLPPGFTSEKTTQELPPGFTQ